MPVNAQEIPARIASFPTWHYDFDLMGHHTQPDKAEWQELRRRHLLTPIVNHYGGTLEGRRVLDLGCNAGFFSLAAIEAGCDFVLGIDGRQTHVDQADLVFETKEIDRDRYRFVCANIIDYEYRKMPPFDVVLCLGVLYHVNKPISLLEALEPINTDLLVIDTKLSSARGSWLELRRDNLDTLLDAVDYELVMVPTAKAVLVMAQQFGYDARILEVEDRDHPAMEKWRYGLFATFLASKQSDLATADAFRFRSLASIYKAQERGTTEASWADKPKRDRPPRRSRLPFRHR